MKNKFINDLPIYINGFVVTYLFIGTKCNFVDIVMLILSIVSFLWYGKTQKFKV